jgi:hypothetical protein
MRECVVGDGVALRQLTARKLRMRERTAPEQKERRPHAFPLERIQNAGGGAGVRAIVEGEHDLLGCQRERVGKMLAADPRRGLRVDRQNACRAERVGIAGAGGCGLAVGRRRRQRERHD